MICDSTGKSRGQSSIPLSALTHPHNFYGLDWQRPIPDLEGMLWLVSVCSLTLEKSGDCIGNPCLWCWAWWGYWIKELLSSFYVSISPPRNTCSYPYAVIACKECLAGESRCHSAFLLHQSSHSPHVLAEYSLIRASIHLPKQPPATPHQWIFSGRQLVHWKEFLATKSLRIKSCWWHLIDVWF